MAKKINGLVRTEWNQTVRELAKQIYQNPKATEADIRRAMSTAFPNFSDKLKDNLLWTSQVYVEVKEYFAQNYFYLWCSNTEINEIADKIVPLFPDTAWMIKDVQRSVFVKALLMDKVKAMVAENLSIKDIDEYNQNQNSFVIQRAKEIIGQFVRKDVFVKFCREINWQMDNMIDQEIERRQTLIAEEEKRAAEVQAKKEEKKKRKAIRRAENAKRLHKILSGQKINIEGGRYAFCCSLSDAVLLQEGALVYSDGVVYRRGKKQKVEETSLQVIETKKKPVKGEEVKLPKNLSVVWVVSASAGENNTFRVTLIPSGFDECSAAVRERFDVGQNFAFEKKDIYEVWQMCEDAPSFCAYCRKATKEEALIAKGERKRVSDEKKNDLSGFFGEKFEAAWASVRA